LSLAPGTCRAKRDELQAVTDRVTEYDLAVARLQSRLDAVQKQLTERQMQRDGMPVHGRNS